MPQLLNGNTANGHNICHLTSFANIFYRIELLMKNLSLIELYLRNFFLNMHQKH